jgi:CheY-like chemotaxis protein
LTIIQGYTGLLLENKDIDPEVIEPLKQVSVAAERAANLTRQLLMFSRKQVMQPQELDLNEVISNVTKFLRRILGEDITLHFNYSPDLPAIYADSGMIEQIIMNLAVNTRDALPRGGQLSIGTSMVEINEAHVQANPESRVGKFVCLRFSDNGSGIPPEVLPKIFEPFFTTKEVGKGTGLGLATVYGIVKQHQGWIEVLSKPAEGTTFRVYLPSTNGPVHSPAKSHREKVERGTERIMVVEDEPELRALVCEILKDYGYQVFEASSGPDALPIWNRAEGKIDLLLTDMVMPGNMTGRELAEKLKAQKPGLKVIYTSGYSVETIGRDFSFKRGLNFLQKPYHPLALVKVVRDCLDS